MAFQPLDRPGPSSGSSSSSGFQPFGDTSLTKVFVGGLAWETRNETLRQYFDQFGDILEAVVITDKNTGRSKGYGFVTFQDPESARKACVDPAPVIDGRRANCNLASLGRPNHALPFGSSTPFGVHGPYFGSYGYQQQVPYNYQPGFTYPPYTYAAYGPEYPYPQGIYNYNPYGRQLYGIAGTQVYPYNEMGQSGYGQQIGGPNINGITSIQAPGFSGQHFIVPTPPHFIRGGQNAGLG